MATGSTSPSMDLGFSLIPWREDVHCAATAELARKCLTGRSIAWSRPGRVAREGDHAIRTMQASIMPRQTRAVTHQPHVGERVQRGIRTMAAILRPTLGPVPRLVAVASPTGTRPPELLDSGGVIARRMLQLADRDEDVGAMLLRGALLRVHDRAGDGVATTSVIFQSVFDDGLSAIAAGCNAMRVRQHLHGGLGVIMAHLERSTIAVSDDAVLEHVARTVCPDEDLAMHLAAIFKVIGEYGQVEFRSGQTETLAHAILEGAYWDTRLHSTLLLADQALRRVEIQRPVIFLSDLDIEQPHDLVPLVRHAKAAGADSLVVIARRLADSCIGFLAANSGPAFPVLAVRTPEGPRGQYTEALEDFEVLTGARALHAASGDSPTRVRIEDLGRARRCWVDQSHVGIIGPAGDPRQWQAHVRALRRAERDCDEPATRDRLVERIARLTGASTLLWVSGASAPKIEERKELAKRTVTALRSALRDGALPGAGVALLACRAQLAERLESSKDAEERAAYRALLRAVEAPTRALAANAGYEPGTALAALDSAPPGHGWDVRTGHIVDVLKAGIVDPTAVVRMALQTGVEGAAQALTLDVLVHPRNPELVTAT